MGRSTGFVLTVAHIAGKHYARACPDGVVVIGRSGKAELQIVDATISSMHVRLTVQSGRAWVEDLGSKNGTWVEGHRLPPNEIVELSAGTAIQLGELFTVTYGPGPLPPEDLPNPFAFSFETGEGDQTADNAPSALAGMRAQSGEILASTLAPSGAGAGPAPGAGAEGSRVPEPPQVDLPWLSQGTGTSSPPAEAFAAPMAAAPGGPAPVLPEVAPSQQTVVQGPLPPRPGSAPLPGTRGRIVFGHGADVVEFSSSAQHPTRSPVKPGSATIVQVVPQATPAARPAVAPSPGQVEKEPRAFPAPAAPAPVPANPFQPAAPVAGPVAEQRPPAAAARMPNQPAPFAPAAQPRPPQAAPMRAPFELGPPASPPAPRTPGISPFRAPFQLGSGPPAAAPPTAGNYVPPRVAAPAAPMGPVFSGGARSADPLPPPLSAHADPARAGLPAALSTPRFEEPPPLSIPRHVRDDRLELALPQREEEEDDEGDEEDAAPGRRPGRGRRGRDGREARDAREGRDDAPGRRRDQRRGPGRRRRRSSPWTFPLVLIGSVLALGATVWLVLHFVVSRDERNLPAPAARHRTSGE
jgi:hypothetical protein